MLPHLRMLLMEDRVIYKDSFSPLSISGLQIWLTANAIGGLSDGDPLTTWPDTSGNSRDVTQVTAAKRPTWRTNVLNGLPVVRFDGTDDLLISAAGAAVGLTGDFTIFGILQGTDTTFDDMVIVWGDQVAGKRRSLWINMVDGYLGFSGYAANVATTYAVKDGSPHYFVITYDGTDVNVRVDGAERATGTPTLNAFTDDSIAVGANQDGTEAYTDDISELGVYASELAGDNLTNMETYLASRSGA